MPRSHPSSPQPRSAELIEIAGSLGRALTEASVSARFLGGLAVALRCPTAREPSPLARGYSDLDLAVTRKARERLAVVLDRHGFAPAERFNAMNGQSRLMFESAANIHIDVFVDRFEMCHRLDLSQRIDVDEVTLPIADLLLTKLQVAELTRKDVGDVTALLADHPLTGDDAGINTGHVTRLLARDWGWWRTVTENLDAVSTAMAGLGLDEVTRTRAHATLTDLGVAIQAAPRTLGWKARARVGDRVAWRQLPEEPAHGERIVVR